MKMRDKINAVACRDGRKREKEKDGGLEREGGWWKAADGQLFEQQFRIFNFMANSQWQQLCTLRVCVCEVCMC